jgi:hypothetical protein
MPGNGQTVSSPQKHTLKIGMVDPAVVVGQIIMHDGPLPASCFGPPESLRHRDLQTIYFRLNSKCNFWQNHWHP